MAAALKVSLWFSLMLICFQLYWLSPAYASTLRDSQKMLQGSTKKVDQLSKGNDANPGFFKRMFRTLGAGSRKVGRGIQRHLNPFSDASKLTAQQYSAHRKNVGDENLQQCFTQPAILKRLNLPMESSCFFVPCFGINAISPPGMNTWLGPQEHPTQDFLTQSLAIATAFRNCPGSTQQDFKDRLLNLVEKQTTKLSEDDLGMSATPEQKTNYAKVLGMGARSLVSTRLKLLSASGSVAFRTLNIILQTPVFSNAVKSISKSFPQETKSVFREIFKQLQQDKLKYIDAMKEIYTLISTLFPGYEAIQKLVKKMMANLTNEFLFGVFGPMAMDGEGGWGMGGVKFSPMMDSFSSTGDMGMGGMGTDYAGTNYDTAFQPMMGQAPMAQPFSQTSYTADSGFQPMMGQAPMAQQFAPPPYAAMLQATEKDDEDDDHPNTSGSTDEAFLQQSSSKTTDKKDVSPAISTNSQSWVQTEPSTRHSSGSVLGSVILSLTGIGIPAAISGFVGEELLDLVTAILSAILVKHISSGGGFGMSMGGFGGASMGMGAGVMPMGGFGGVSMDMPLDMSMGGFDSYGASMNMPAGASFGYGTDAYGFGGDQYAPGNGAIPMPPPGTVGIYGGRNIAPPPLYGSEPAMPGVAPVPSYSSIYPNLNGIAMAELQSPGEKNETAQKTNEALPSSSALDGANKLDSTDAVSASSDVDKSLTTEETATAAGDGLTPSDDVQTGFNQVASKASDSKASLKSTKRKDGNDGDGGEDIDADETDENKLPTPTKDKTQPTANSPL